MPRKALPFVLGAALVLLVVVGLVIALSGGDDEGERNAATSDELLLGPSQAPFTLRYPSTWQSVPPRELERAVDDAQTPPLAAIRRNDRSGLVTVTVRERAPRSLSELRRRTERELRDRFPGVRIVGSGGTRTAAGRALSITFVPRGEPRSQTIVLIPAGDRSFALDAVLRADAREAAQELGPIVRSFDVPDR